MRFNAFPWLVALAPRRASGAAAQDGDLYNDDDGINWFGDDGYESGAGGTWDYDSDLIGDDEWEYDDDNLLTGDDGTSWGSDSYGDYDSDYDWGTDDDTFDSWYGDGDRAFGAVGQDD